MISRASVSLLLVCPSDVIRLQGLPLMFQEFRVPENLGPVVPLHDEGPVGVKHRCKELQHQHLGPQSFVGLVDQ